MLPTLHIHRKRKQIIARTRAQTGLCPSCGYDLRATPERCPECGATATATHYNPHREGNNAETL